MMAGGADPVRSLCEEATCPICLGYFQEPVLTPCGHVFCHACIAQHWGKSGGGAQQCPQCREACTPDAPLRPVRPLASIAEIARRFSLREAVMGSKIMCQDHQEPLKLFCHQDQALLCLACDRSKEHREHQVVPKKEAFEEYKGRIWDHLESLKTEREEILSCKLENENESQNLLKGAEAERQKIVAEFKQLRQFLEEKEQLLLTQLKNLDDGIQEERNKIVDMLSTKISSVDQLIKEMEEKHKQPEDEFLQDIKSTLQRCNGGKFEEPNTAFPQLKANIQHFSETHSFLQHVMKKFKDTVVSGFDGKKDMPFPKLAVSTYQSLPYGFGQRQAYYCWSSVMGLERINSGRHSWLVDVGHRRYWIVGVAKEDLRDLDQIQLSPEEGVWAVGKLSLNNDIAYANDNAYCAFTPPGIPQGQFWIPAKFTLRSLSVPPMRIRVSLNYEEGSVTFSDADTHGILYAFRGASFTGAKLCSWLIEGRTLMVK